MQGKKKKKARKVVKKPAKKATAKVAKKPLTSKKAPVKRAKSKKRVSTKAKAKKTTRKTSPKKAAASSELAVGMYAPNFSLAHDQGGALSIDQFTGKKNILLYFYPKDNTPGCTLQACTFQNDLAKYEALNTVVLGVSADDAKSHGKFRQKFNLSFPLLIDDDHYIAEKYGVWVEKNMYGKKSMGIKRTTFLIDKTGKIAAIWPKVKVEGHSTEVLAVLSHLR